MLFGLYLFVHIATLPLKTFSFSNCTFAFRSQNA